MSPSVWWDNRTILNDVQRFAAPHRPHIWLDMGGREGADGLINARMLRDRLLANGWRSGDDFRYYEDRRADHSERSWARRAPAVLEFLFPPQQLITLNGS
jgi:predicted alpha/beta superfamily hydrolase